MPPRSLEESLECGVADKIREYGEIVKDSLNNALDYSISMNRQANDSLSELESQSEKLNRIKLDLNEAHENLTLVQKIVGKYVNSLKWIGDSIPWIRSTLIPVECAKDYALESKECCFVLPGASFFADLFRKSHDTESVENWKDTRVKDSLENFSRDTSHKLDAFLHEVEEGREKARLMFLVVENQNKEFEMIGSSAKSLKQRVANVNDVLRSNAN